MQGTGRRPSGPVSTPSLHKALTAGACVPPGLGSSHRPRPLTEARGLLGLRLPPVLLLLALQSWRSGLAPLLLSWAISPALAARAQPLQAPVRGSGWEGEG